MARCRDAQAKGDVVGLSAITVSELEFGAYNSGDYDTEIVAVRKILTPFEVFEYDGTICPTHYGRIRHELEQAGQAIGAMDLLIAAHMPRPRRDAGDQQSRPLSASLRPLGDAMAVM